MSAQIFIAYSKDDAVWRKRLTTMLAPLVQLGLSAWDDTHLQPGQHQQQCVAEAIARACIAVLLVSADFLDSEFLGKELSDSLTAAHRDRGLRILLIAVRPCLWKQTTLATYDFVHDAEQPLSTLPDAELALVQICTRIKEAIGPALVEGGRPAKNPYRGLSAFQPDESHLFFGRAEVTQKLCRDFQALNDKPGATRLLTILGPSGSGKSSVARAGLLAALARSSSAGAQPLRIAILKPGSRPIESLAKTLVPLLPPEPGVLTASRTLAVEQLLRSAQSGDQGLRRFADNLPQIQSCPLVLLVDQFEEIYTLCTDKKERDALVALLLHAASDDSRQVAVILTLRSDFLGETQREHAPLNRLIAAQSVIVPALNITELREVIAEPAVQAGRPIDPATVEFLLTEARGNQGALPLLEFALTRIWDGLARGESPATTLRQLGGIGGALAGEAQKIYLALTASEQDTARRALVRLVQLGEGTRDTRRRVPITELCGHAETSDTVLAVLRRFAGEGARLVTLSGDGETAVAEVTHEALFDHWHELRQWIDASRDDRRFLDRVVEASRLWQEAGHPVGRLWRPPDLDLLRDFQRRRPHELGKPQAEFLAAALQRQRQEKLRNAGAVLTVLAVAVLAAGIYVTKERQRSREEKRRTQELHDKLLDSYVERGQQLLFESGKPSESLLWLHRAQTEGSKDSALPDLLRSAMQSIDATQAVLIGHTDIIVTATFSRDGRRIVTASLDHTARVWDAEGGRLLSTLTGHGGIVLSAMFSPDGRRIVTASADKTARVWDAESGRLLFALTGHGSSVRSARFSPDGRRIVTASEDHTARLWDAEDGRLLSELTGHKDNVVSAIFSPDGRRLVTASEDRTARVWSAEGGLLSELTGHGASVVSATFSPDGRRIVTASWDSTAKVWDAEDGRLLSTLKGHGDNVVSAAFSSDGRRIVTASADKTARVWDAEGGQLLSELKSYGSSVVSATFSPDGHRIVTASADKTARVWDTEGGRLLAELKGHGGSIASATFSPDGRRIVTASEDRTARVWNAQEARLLSTLTGHTNITASATFSPDGRRIVTTSEDRTARVWDAQEGRLLSTLTGHESSVVSAVFSPDGRRIVTASADKTARVWDAEGGRRLAELTGHGSSVKSAMFSPDGRRIVTASWDGTARVWNVEDGRLLAELTGHRDSLRSATFSPDGHRIVTASEDNTARLWDAEGGRLLAELKGHGGSVRSATFSRDGRRIVTASADKTARVWDAQSGQLRSELKGHTDSVVSATFSRDGHRIVTASVDKTARVWDAEGGRLLSELKGHGGSVKSATFSPDGRRIVTASMDHTARVWDAEDGRLLSELKGHGDGVGSATFSPDGHRIVTASEDNTARVWDLSPETRDSKQIARLIRCHVPVEFERGDSNIIVFRIPEPKECQ